MTVFVTYKDRPKRGRVINEAFNFILTLGEQMLKGLLNFFGMEVSDVKVKGSGDFNLEELAFGL